MKGLYYEVKDKVIYKLFKEVEEGKYGVVIFFLE